VQRDCIAAEPSGHKAGFFSRRRFGFCGEGCVALALRILHKRTGNCAALLLEKGSGLEETATT
jgi:hypothetical protein